MALVEPLADEDLNPILEDFHANGATIIRGALSRDECERMIERLDQIYAEPYFADMRNVKVKADHDGKKPIVVHRLFECDRTFRDLLVREPRVQALQHNLELRKVNGAVTLLIQSPEAPEDLSEGTLRRRHGAGAGDWPAAGQAA